MIYLVIAYTHRAVAPCADQREEETANVQADGLLTDYSEGRSLRCHLPEYPSTEG